MNPRVYSLLISAFVLASWSKMVPAATIDLAYVAAATAIDEGPQDGTFDAELGGDSLGQVDNNGFVNIRTAFEFSLATLPDGAAVQSATLSLVMNAGEGPRQIEFHGYEGDGVAGLDDMAMDGLIDSVSLGPGFGIALAIDVTAYIDALVNSGAGFAGFNVREEPANAASFVIADIVMQGGARPELSVTFVPLPGAFGLMLGGLGLIGLRRARQG